jgi:beta-phosphoglucomutase-like phosphatase (HAD superfamily)
MSRAAVEGIIYDYDGLLVDTEDLWFRGCQQACAKFGVEIIEAHRQDLMRSQLSAYLVERFELPIDADRMNYVQQFTNLLMVPWRVASRYCRAQSNR